MDRERADKLHAELGYRSARTDELRARDWLSLRDEGDAFAKTPAEFERLVAKLRGKAYREKLTPEVKRARKKKPVVTREQRRAAKAAARAAARKARRKAQAKLDHARLKKDPVRWARVKLKRRIKYMRLVKGPAGRAKLNAQQQARRLRYSRNRAAATVYACVVCAVTWCPIFWGRRGAISRRRLCSKACIAEDHRRRQLRRYHEGKRKKYSEWTEAQRENNRRRMREKAAARRAARVAERAVVVHTCARCGARWCVVPWRRLGVVSKYCGTNCQKLSAPAARPAIRSQRDQAWRERNRDVINAKAREARRRRSNAAASRKR